MPVWKAYLIFSLCAALYLLPFMRFMFLGSDEGTLLVGAARVAHGQVFARDFFELMGPGTFYWLAAFFKTFGIDILARSICLFVASFGTALAMFFLGRQVCASRSKLPLLILAGCYFGAAWPGISHHVDSNFFGLAAVACVMLWHRRRNNILLLLAGILAGITTCVFQPKGLLIQCAFLLWLWIDSRRLKPPLAALAILTTGYAAILAMALLYFWSQGALGSLIYANFTFVSQHYSSVNHVAYAQGILKDYWFFWIAVFGGSVWAVALAAVLIVPLLFVAALPLIALLMAARYPWKSVTPEILLCSLAGAAAFAAEMHRKDIYHLVFGAPLLILLCIHVLSRSHTRLAKASLRILAVSSVCLMSYNWLIVAAASHPTPSRAGTVRLFGSDPVLKYLLEHSASGEDIFVYPYSPTYYFLSATTNPTRYSILMYNYNLPSQFHEVVAELEQKHVRLVVWDTGFNAKVNVQVFPGNLPANPADLIVEPYLASHYRVLQQYGDIQILERK
jgi:hypothetical protein